MGGKQRIGEQQLAAVADFRESDQFSAEEKTVLRYAEEMTRTPVAVPQALFEELKRYFNTAQIVELTASLALENFRARFNHALEVESDGLCELPPDHPVRKAAASGN